MQLRLLWRNMKLDLIFTSRNFGEVLIIDCKTDGDIKYHGDIPSTTAKPNGTACPASRAKT